MYTRDDIITVDIPSHSRTLTIYTCGQFMLPLKCY